MNARAGYLDGASAHSRATNNAPIVLEKAETDSD